jgi:glycosyltransferase involved in cell wall biosynthesis
MAAYVDNLVKKLVKKRHQVSVMTRGSLRARQETANGVHVFGVPYLPAYPFHVHIHKPFVNRLIRFMEHHLDIIHVHSPYVPSINTSLPVLTTIHGLERVDLARYEAVGIRKLAYKSSAIIFSSMETALFENSDQLTAVSSSIRNELEKYYGLKRECAVVGNGVDEQWFVPPGNHRGGKKDCVLYVGRIDYGKGLFDLMKCAKQVCKERPGSSFVLVGGGPLLGLLNREAKRMGIEKNVLFAGYARERELLAFYQNASVCVLPSRYEGLPTVMLEAMACAVPVVATRIGAHLDVISNGSNGLLVDVGSTEDLAKCILDVLDDSELRQRIGRAARETVEGRYTWEKVSRKFVEFYETLVER